MKFQPPQLPRNPTSEQWRWWKNCFSDGLTINEIKDDSHKLTFLRTHAGPELFPLLEKVGTFKDAMEILDKQFKTPTRIVYSRHQLLSCAQKPGELISDYVKRLKILVHQCECNAITADEHKNLLLRDSLISGIASDQIRARLLELDDAHASLNECISLAMAIEISTDYSRSFRSPAEESDTALAITDGNYACSSQRPPPNDKTTFHSPRTCFFCGRGPHPRRSCPAREAMCHKCGKKGHWMAVCRSQSSTMDSTRTTASTFLCSIDSTKLLYSSISVNHNHNVKALIDSGSSHSFITTELASKLKLPIKWQPASTCLADNSYCTTRGYTNVNICVGNTNHDIQLTVTDSLVAEVIIGMDFLAQHESVELQTGGRLPKISCANLPAANIVPPNIFSSGLTNDVRPITTKPRYTNPANKEFIRVEVKRLLEEGIIQKSTSPWRAQVFVVRDRKPRMVVDYSETINLFTKLDAYPLTSVETVLNSVAENHYFSRLDLKSAYHQIAIKPEDRQYTAFEADGDLYEFTRLAFGLTNAVPVFQRIIDNIVKENNLQKTYPYLDDVTICGKTLEEHDKNLEEFMEVARTINLTLNTSKCVFRQTRIALLGHILEKGTKKPDPDRLKPLMEFPIPKTQAQSKRLTGFFAYYAKWIGDYANKVKPLLDAQKENSFPLDEHAEKAIANMKEEVANSLLVLPERDAGPLTLETDASGTAIGAVLSQATRPIAFFSRTLSPAEQKFPIVEREAMAIVEATRKWSDYLHAFHCIIKTDQKSISFIFSKVKSRVKNDKLARWRLELSEYDNEVVYRKGTENASADALSRIASLTSDKRLQELHDCLAHPGVARLWEYVQRHNLPFSISEVRDLTANCETCLECKSKFFNPPPTGHLIKASRPFERLNMDILGPKIPSSLSGRRFLLVIIDEFSRFPFAFVLKDISTESIVGSLKQLFAIFGTPAFVHSDRGTQFMAANFDEFLNRHGISHSRTTPYNPRANGQTERYNGVIWKSVKCLLHSRKLPLSMWENVLPEALAANRALICTATNESPHARLFNFPRGGTQGFSLPRWLSPGKEAYTRRFHRNKDDPEVQPVRILEVLNPHFARIEKKDGGVDTVSTRHLSPGKKDVPDFFSHSSEDAPQPTEADDPSPSVLSPPSRPTRHRNPPERLQIQW